MSEKTEPEENKSDVDLIPLENIAIKSTKNSIFTLPLKRFFNKIVLILTRLRYFKDVSKYAYLR